MRRTRMMLAALLLAATVTTAGPAGAEPAVMDPPPTRRAECFDTTANVLLDRLPGDHPSLSCLPRSQLSGPVGRSARAVLASVPVVPAVCSPSDCAIYIWGQRGIGHQVIWTYPVQTVDFYGYRCYEELNSRPQGHPSTDAFGIYNGTGTMVRSPSEWLQWCTQNGLVRPGATVTCGGVATYPYFTTFSCTNPITAWFKPTRTVYGTWRWYKNGDYKATDHLTATIVAGGSRDVLIREWDW